MLRPRWAERARRLIRSEVTSRGELGADPGEQRVDFCQGLLGRQPAERGIPHPLVAHGAGATRRGGWIGDATQRGGDPVAVLEGRDELGAAVLMVAKPVQDLGEAPFGRVRAAAPRKSGETGARNGGCFAPRAVVAPKIEVVERLEVPAHWHDSRACGVDGEGRNAMPGRGTPHRFGQCTKLIPWRLRGVMWVAGVALDRAGRHARTHAPARA